MNLDTHIQNYIFKLRPIKYSVVPASKLSELVEFKGRVRPQRFGYCQTRRQDVISSTPEIHMTKVTPLTHSTTVVEDTNCLLSSPPLQVSCVHSVSKDF